MRIRTATEEETKRLDRDFTHHPAREDQVDSYVLLRRLAQDLAKEACLHLPQCRELSLAITKLEEFVFWANAGIARNT